MLCPVDDTSSPTINNVLSLYNSEINSIINHHNPSHIMMYSVRYIFRPHIKQQPNMSTGRTSRAKMNVV